MALTNGLVVRTPTSVATVGTGSTATINTNGSVSFATCTTLSLNGVFTSSYDNYMVCLRSSGSSSLNLNIRMRASGTDNSATGYYRQELGTSSGTVNSGQALSTSARFFYSSVLNRAGNTGFIFGPYLVQPTVGRSVGVTGDNNVSLFDESFNHLVSASYDGFSLIVDTGNVSGLITVFGFNK